MNGIFTSCVLQTIVICISVIIIVSCVLKFIWLLKKPAECGHNNGCDECYRVKKVSYKFVIAILVGIVVLLFSLSYYTIENLFDFMSFASAIVSIILAVLTIIYTYYTQGTTNTSAEKIEKSSIIIKQATEDIVKATQSYSATADNLDNNIQQILAKLEGISAKVGAGPDYASSQESSKEQKLSDEIITNFCDVAPGAGCLLIFACSKIQSTGIHLNLYDIFPEDKVMYFVGFAISLNSIGLIQISMNAKLNIIERASVSSNLELLIEKRLKEDVEEGNEFIISNKDKIDRYFANKSSEVEK